MVRNLLSVIAGIATGNFAFWLMQIVARSVSPPPAGVDISKITSLKEIIDSMPFYAWLIVIFGYAVGTLAAGFVTGRIAESKVIMFPLTLAVFFMLGWLINIMMFPHPLWVVATVFLIFVPFSLAGQSLAMKYSPAVKR